jgi:hypothetical protein
MHTVCCTRDTGWHSSDILSRDNQWNQYSGHEARTLSRELPCETTTARLYREMRNSPNQVITNHTLFKNPMSIMFEFQPATCNSVTKCDTTSRHIPHTCHRENHIRLIGWLTGRPWLRARRCKLSVKTCKEALLNAEKGKQILF